MKNKILVTGGAGFIGSHLVDELVKRGEQVVVLDKLLRGNKLDNDILGKITFVEGDVCDRDLVMKLSEKCDYIYHFAAVLGVDIVADNPVETMNVEVVGTRNIVDAALINKVKKIIYASTSGIYGHSEIDKSVSEDSIVDPRTSYAIAKRYNEIYLSAQFEEKGLESVALRFFNVYGPRQDERMVIPRFINQIRNNKDITVFGAGIQTRDFTYIADTIKATLLLMEKSKGAQIVNIANENEVTILDLAKSLQKLIKSKSQITFVNAPQKRSDFEVERRFGCSDKLYDITRYKPTTSLIEGLNKILHPIHLEN